MRIAVGQMDCVPGDVKANGETAAGLVAEAARKGAEVMVLPELADVGYVLDKVPAAAEPWDDSRYLEIVGGQAAEDGVVVISGMAERVGDDIFNSIVVTAGPGSILAGYRKIHLFGDTEEKAIFQPGERLVQIGLGDVRIGLTVCFDIRFPVLYRALAQAGSHLLVVSAAFPFPKQRAWSTMLAARALENQCYVAGSNRVGRDGDIGMVGSSAIHDPLGTVLASLDEASTGVAVADVSASFADDVQRDHPILPDERPPDFYTVGSPSTSTVTRLS